MHAPAGDLCVRPVIGVGVIPRRQPDDVVVSVDAESQDHAIGVREIGGHLVDFQYFAVVEAGVSHAVDILFRYGGSVVGQFFRVF